MLNFDCFENASILKTGCLLLLFFYFLLFFLFLYSLSYEFVFSCLIFHTIFIFFYFLFLNFFNAGSLSTFVFLIVVVVLSTRTDIARFMQRFAFIFTHSSSLSPSPSPSSLTLSSSSLLSQDLVLLLVFQDRFRCSVANFVRRFVVFCGSFYVCMSVGPLVCVCSCFEPFWLCSVKFEVVLFCSRLVEIAESGCLCKCVILCLCKMYKLNMCDGLAEVLQIHCIRFSSSLLQLVVIIILNII